MNAWCALARDNPPALAALYRFNFHPADYLHASRRRLFVESASEELWREPRSRRGLSAWILRKLGMVDRPCEAADARPAFALALSSPSRLAELARYAGAAALGGHIRGCLSRTDVLAWKERLTPPIFEFVATTAPLLPMPSGIPAFDPGHDIAAVGFELVEAALSTLPAEVQMRAQLKIPLRDSAPRIDGAAAAPWLGKVFRCLEGRWLSSSETRPD